MSPAGANSLSVFGPATQRWFAQAFERPTPVQVGGFAAIGRAEHALLIAPTGSGKTLAAFLACLDRLSRAEPTARAGVRVVYVSPLKALAHDVERNLRAPLIGIERTAKELGVPIRIPRVAIRTGDTSAKERRAQAADPADILVTTPESLYLVLGSLARETLRTVETVIVDEVHALAPTKRGAHLALSLERLSHLAERDPQRIGLSATATPLDEVARFLGGDREVTVIDTSATPLLDLGVVVPVPDMTRPVPPPVPAADLGPEEPPPPQHGLWPVLVPKLLELIEAHRTTIVFVNSRSLAERLVQRLTLLAGEPMVRAHHGSLAHGARREVEEELKSGRIRCIVATSSLELGIDMGAVDLVILVESPGSVSRGLQRVGRAGHGVGQVSIGRVFPKHRGDLLEATVVARKMRRGEIEALSIPMSPLDILAQQVVAMTAMDPWRVDELERLVRRAASFRDVPNNAFRGVLDMLSGRYPSSSFADLRPRIVWDREADLLSPRKGSRMLAAISGGTIPDRGTYSVHLGHDGPRVGELDEEMVYETHAGATFTLGATTWRVEEITRDRVIVSHAPGEAGTLPFWRGDGPHRPIELGRAMGAFLRALDAKLSRGPDGAAARDWLVAEYGLDSHAAENLVRFVAEQKEMTGALPTDRAITVERFKDELGDTRVSILTPFGARVHAPWALALETRLANTTGFEIQTMYSDDGICLRFADAEDVPELDQLFPDPDEVHDLVVGQLGQSALFAGRFRENAARALLLPRRRPGSRTPLWQQRLRSQQLLAVARQFPAFPIVVETYRECLSDVFDMPALVEVLRGISSREIRVDHVDTAAASPFARSLAFAYVAEYLYEGDQPLAERRAQALSLDRELLRELLGEDELRQLLDPEVIDEIERELQCLTPDRKARDADDVHDLLRRLGALTDEELEARTEGAHTAFMASLVSSRRSVQMAISGVPRWVAIEDVALYRDALGAVPPPGIPSALLEPRARPLEELLARFAARRGPFSPQIAADAFGGGRAAVDAVFRLLESRGALLRGRFLSEGAGEELCDADVLRRIKRRTLARLRNEVEPVPRSTLVRFLPAWHGVGQGRGRGRLEEALQMLEGLPLPWSELERCILPARVADFESGMLDELGALGLLVWVGHAALGPADGAIALYRRDRVGKLLAPPDPEQAPKGALPSAILRALEQRGACFFPELAEACREAGVDEHEEVVRALFDLVFAGLVTNDTLQPLRAFGMSRTPRRSGRRRGVDLRTVGRWSLVRSLVASHVAETERGYARAVALLERHGVVSREAAELETLPGGFSAVYRVLRAMEEAGKIRRGYFVEGIGGSQFGYPGAVDRLRGFRDPHREPEVHVLSAIDPANAFGWIVPWPTAASTEAARPRRAAGAMVSMVDGELVAYLERGGRTLITFPCSRDALAQGLGALRETVSKQKRKTVRVEEVDGIPVRQSELLPLLRELGFSSDHRGLVIEPTL